MNLVGKACAAARVLVHDKDAKRYEIKTGDPGRITDFRKGGSIVPYDMYIASFEKKGDQVNFALPVHLLAQYVDIKE